MKWIAFLLLGCSHGGTAGVPLVDAATDEQILDAATNDLARPVDAAGADLAAVSVPDFACPPDLALAPLGTPCAAPAECASTFCTDGFCCNVASCSPGCPTAPNACSNCAIVPGTCVDACPQGQHCVSDCSNGNLYCGF